MPRLPGETEDSPDDEHVLAFYLVHHLTRAASVDAEAGASASAWRRLAAAAEVCMTLRHTDLFRFSLLPHGLRVLHQAFEEAVALQADDPGRARVRATLRGLDIEYVARRALRWTGAVNLQLADTRKDLAPAHSAVERALGHALRDRAELHHGWADIVEVSEGAPPGDRPVALKALGARSGAAEARGTVTARLLPDASLLWEHVAASEAHLAALLAE